MLTTRSVLFFVLVSFSSLALSAPFQISRLPHGKDVTLVRPATTLVPLSERATFTATDNPQTLSFKAIWKGKGAVKNKEIKLAIYDETKDKVLYVKINTKVPFLYTFKGLNSVSVIPQALNKGMKPKDLKNLKLQVESNRPLSIAR